MKPIFILFLFVSAPVLAKTMSFQEVWEQIYAKSLAIEGAQDQKEAAALAMQRSQYHWLPSFYLDAKIYSTNEPANSFVGLLQQSAVEANDFNPTDLNKPNDAVYSRAAIGMNWSIYEGGMQQALSKISSIESHSKNIEGKKIELDLYAKVAGLYAEIAALNKNLFSLNEISIQLKKVIKNFQLGNRSNPVGYAGLLGLKSLDHRIQGLINQYTSQLDANLIALRELGLKEENWKTENIEIRQFVDKKLMIDELRLEKSYSLQQRKMYAQIAEHSIELQQARFLPQAGLFAEAYTFDGNRKTDQGYTAGLYLKWSLFDSKNLNAVKEAQLSARAAAKFTESYAAQDRAESQAYLKSLATTKENLKLLEESESYLIEQQKSVLNLFKNGSVNVLQLAEVLNRRVDLISHYFDAQSTVLKISSELLKSQTLNKIKNSKDEYGTV